jgi:hypothetical protein
MYEKKGTWLKPQVENGAMVQFDVGAALRRHWAR